MDTVKKWLNPSAPLVNYETKPKDTGGLWFRRFETTNSKSSARRPGTPLHVLKAGNRAQKEDAPDQSRSLGRSGSTNLPIPTSKPSEKPKAEVITTKKSSAQTQSSTRSERVDQANHDHEQPAIDASERGGSDARTKPAIAGRLRSPSVSLIRSPSFASVTGRSQRLRTKVDAVPQNPYFRPLADIGAPDNSKSADLIRRARLTHVTKKPPMGLEKQVLNHSAPEYISNTTVGPQLLRSGTTGSVLTDSIMGSEQRSKSAVSRVLRPEKDAKRSEPAVKHRTITRPDGEPSLKRNLSVALESSNGVTSSIEQRGLKQESSQSCLVMMLASEDHEARPSIDEKPPELPPRRMVSDPTVIAEPPKFTSTKAWDSATTAQDSLRGSRASTATMETTYLPELDEEWFDPSFVQQLVQDSVENESGKLDWRNASGHKENARYVGKYIVHVPNRHRYDRPPGKLRQSTAYEKRSGRRSVAYGERLTCK